MSQPLFYVLLAIGVFGLILFPFIPYNTLGEDIKMVKDEGLTLIMVLSIIMALWTASVSIADEIEGRTALTLLSKPVGRRQFILGKFLGILVPVAIMFLVLGAMFLASVSYKVVYDARETAQPEPTLAECQAGDAADRPRPAAGVHGGRGADGHQRGHLHAAADAGQPDHLRGDLRAGPPGADPGQFGGGADRVRPLRGRPAGGDLARARPLQHLGRHFDRRSRCREQYMAWAALYCLVYSFRGHAGGAVAVRGPRSGLIPPTIEACACSYAARSPRGRRAALLATGPSARAQNGNGPKKLIEWGWDEPDPHFMRQNIARMESLPFDGVIFHVSGDRGGNFSWDLWGSRKFELAEFSRAIDDLRATPFRRLTDRFLRVNVTPGGVDWFDDSAWDVVAHNFAVAAQIAKQTGCVGIMFDVEQYGKQLFNFGKQPQRTGKTFDAYRAQVRRRGRQWMKAVNASYGDITVLLTYAYSITGGGPKVREGESYGLLADFLDGMLGVVTPQTKLVDAWEGAYGYKTKEQFEFAYARIKRKLARRAADPQKYRRQFQAAFGIWLDLISGGNKAAWHTDDLSWNYFTPAAFENSVRLALAATDRYVWIYTEQPRWWTAERLPAAYVAALRRARQATPPTPWLSPIVASRLKNSPPQPTSSLTAMSKSA